MKATAYTAAARKKAKLLLAAFYQGQIQIWSKAAGYEVMTFEPKGHTYGSVMFESKAEAFRHIIVRAANTGHDIERFGAIAGRYFRRFINDQHAA